MKTAEQYAVITELMPGSRQTVFRKDHPGGYARLRKRRIFEVSVDDGHGVLKAKWFKGREPS